MTQLYHSLEYAQRTWSAMWIVFFFLKFSKYVIIHSVSSNTKILDPGFVTKWFTSSVSSFIPTVFWYFLIPAEIIPRLFSHLNHNSASILHPLVNRGKKCLTTYNNDLTYNCTIQMILFNSFIGWEPEETMDSVEAIWLE